MTPAANAFAARSARSHLATLLHRPPGHYEVFRRPSRPGESEMHKNIFGLSLHFAQPAVSANAVRQIASRCFCLDLFAQS